MVISRMSLVEVLQDLGVQHDPNLIREAMKAVVQAIMELEATVRAGAERYERNPERITHHNGYRVRKWDTPVGSIKVAIPRLRCGPGSPPSGRSWLRISAGSQSSVKISRYPTSVQKLIAWPKAMYGVHHRWRVRSQS